MNIKVEIQAPELVKAITLLADALNKQDATMRQYMVSASSKEQAPSHTPVETVTQPVSEFIPAEQPPMVSEMDVVALRKIVTDGIQDGKFTNADVRNKISEFGKSKLTDLLPEQYEAFLGLLFEK